MKAEASRMTTQIFKRGAEAAVDAVRRREWEAQMDAARIGEENRWYLEAARAFLAKSQYDRDQLNREAIAHFYGLPVEFPKDINQ